jgi:hypothetical protein
VAKQNVDLVQGTSCQVGKMLQELQKQLVELIGHCTLHMMMMSSTNYTLGIDHQGPFWLPNILSWGFSKKEKNMGCDGSEAKHDIWS